MLCSHEHRDHNGKEAVTLRQGMNSPFTVRTIDTWHDDQQGTLRGSNLIHILDDGQFTVAHLGFRLRIDAVTDRGIRRP